MKEKKEKKEEKEKKKGRKMINTPQIVTTVASVAGEKKEKEKKPKSARRKSAQTPRGEIELEGEWRKEFEKTGVFVEAKEFPKVHRTVGDCIPSYVAQEEVPPHISDLFEFFKEDWKVTPVPFRETYGSGTKDTKESNKLVPLHYDGDGIEGASEGHLSKLYTFENEKQAVSAVDPTVINGALLSKTCTLPSRESLIKDLQSDRYNALALGEVDSLSKTDNRPLFHPLGEGERDKFEIMMEMKEFQMTADIDIDTFYGSVALYHFNLDKLSLSKGRMSEFFHICLTEPNQSRSATFNFESPSPELFLVFRFEKNLWGELEHATNFYTKSSLKPKEKAKLEKEGNEHSRRLGNYTQPLICAAIQLFPSDGEVVGKELPRNHTLTNLVRMSDSDMSDTNIQNHIKSLMKKEESKGFSLTNFTTRQKVLLGRLVFSLCHLSANSPPVNNLVNSSLLSLATSRASCPLPTSPRTPKSPKSPKSTSSPSSPASPSSVPVKEVEYFPTLEGDDVVEPHLNYTHCLYIYPESANFGNHSSFKVAAMSQNRNITVYVQLKLDDGPNAPALNSIFGKTTTNPFVSEAHTSVAYHEVKPRWFEEVKMKLPLNLTPKHHLFFTLKHVNCKGKGKDQKVEEEIGFAWLPLGQIAEGKEFVDVLKDGEYDLRVAHKLPPSYLTADPAEVVWCEKGREIFSLRTKMVSSLFSSDSNIQDFFFHYNEGKKTGDWGKIGPVIKSLSASTPLELSHFFPIIANQLFCIFEMADDDVAKECLYIICHMISTITSSTNEEENFAYRHPIVSAYVSTVFERPNLKNKDSHTPKDTFSPKMIRLWTALATTDNDEENPDNNCVTNSDTFAHFLWFMFDIVVKARVQRLSKEKLLPFPVVKGGNEREQDIAKEITKETIDLMKVILVLEIQPTLTLLRRDSTVDITRETGLPPPGKSKAVQSVEQLSFFVKDLLPIFPLSSICEITKFFCERIEGNKAGNVTLSAAKFYFLRILSDHEAFNEVNQPPKSEPRVLETEEVMETLSFRHPLIAMIVKEVLKSIRSNVTQVDSEERLIGITLLTDLLNRLAADARYQKPELQRRFFSMYFLYVAGIMEEERENNVLTKSVAKKIDRPSLIRILLCFLFVLRKVGSEYMRDWMMMNNMINLKFFQILWTAIESFYPESDGHADFMLSVLRTPKETAALKGVQELSKRYKVGSMGILPGGSPANSSGPVAPTGPAAGNSGAFQQGTNSGAMAQPPSFSSFDKDRATGTINVKGTLRKFKKMGSTVTKRSNRSPAALHLHREVALMIIECLWYVMTDFKYQEHVVTKMIEILIKQKHSEEFLDHLFTMIFFYTEQYKEALFLKKTSYCGDITYQLMRCCNFKSKKIRSQAATLLYLFFRKNWELSGHLVRMKLQCSVALARLVGDVNMKGTRWLSASLKALVAFSKTDKQVTAEFREQLDDLLGQRLSEILTKVSVLRKFNDDREMFADVLFQISKGWRDSPDIRYHWMEALAKRHESDGEFEEAAQCRIHLAGLVISHLAEMKPEQVPYTGQPVVKARMKEALMRAAPNCGPEFVVECNPQTAIAEGMCCSESFTCAGFEKVLKLASANLEKVQLFETSLEVSRLLSISLIHSRNWEDISGLYGGSANLASSIVDSDRTQSRLFSNYYRVTLYGAKFEENNGQSFIYKEQGFVRLSDLSTRLTQQFGALYGPQNVQMLSNSWKGEVSELDPEKAFFQIIAVLPYFTPEELLKRPSPFERATNLREFIYETPYSADPEVKLSKAGTKDLGKIKTILKTEHTFPFVLKRIKIVEKQEQKLTPIETNIEIMKDRIQKLNLECDAEIPNAKTLQIVLQGSVLLQVNAGPTEICRVFCGKKEGEDPNQKDEEREVMKKLFREFLVGCERALELNSAIIGREQLEFHQELMKGFGRVTEEVESLIGEPIEE